MIINYSGTSNEYSSPVIGYAINSYISNINVKGNTEIKAKYGGGVLGYSYGNNVLNNCEIDSSVQFLGGETRTGHYGGIVASSENYNWFVVENCINNANMSPSYGHNGGIAGNINNNSIIAYNCTNNGNITCTNVNNCGGIVGKAYGGHLINCTNYGKLSGGTSGTTGQYGFGGIVGCSYNQRIYLMNCINNGVIDVTGNAAAVGGILGVSVNGIVATNCYNNGELKWSSGTCYPINKSFIDCVLTDETFDSLDSFQEYINNVFTSTDGSSASLTLNNVTISSGSGAISIPNKVTSVVSNRNLFNEIKFVDSSSAQNVVISIPNSIIEIKDDYVNKRISFVGDNSTVTVNGKLAGLGIGGNGSSVIINKDLFGSVSFSGNGNSSVTISDDVTIHCVNFNGPGNYTVTNYGKITNKEGGGHVIYTQSPATFIVNNYGTIENTKTGAIYALLFYNSCDATLKAYAGSVLSTDYANLIIAYSSAGNVKFMYQNGASIIDGESAREFDSFKGKIQVVELQ